MLVQSDHEMTISLDRQARIGNGLLVLCGGLLSWFPPARAVGFILLVLMGLGLIWSGIVNFCGWFRVLATMPWNSTLKPPTDSTIG